MVWYLEDIEECFYLMDVGKLVCLGTAVNTDAICNENSENGEEQYIAIVKIDKIHETTLDKLPETLRDIVKKMLGKGGGRG